jgi:hypothetical protein
MEKETLSANEVQAIFDAAGLQKPEPHWGALEKKWADEDEAERKLRGESEPAAEETRDADTEDEGDTVEADSANEAIPGNAGQEQAGALSADTGK